VASEEGRTVTAMDVNEIRQRLEQDLRSTGSRLRERGWLVDPRRLNEGTPAEDYWTR
jgi:predicted transcriptional regulator of viral defense system